MSNAVHKLIYLLFSHIILNTKERRNKIVSNRAQIMWMIVVQYIILSLSNFCCGVKGNYEGASCGFYTIM